MLTTIIVATLSAVLSANLAVGRFKKEKEWEKKEEAFSILIRAIRYSLEYAEEYMEAFHAYQPLPHDQNKNLDRIHKKKTEAMHEADLIRSRNYIFLSREEADIADELFSDLPYEDQLDVEQIASEEIKKLNELLEKTIHAAKVSLHTERSNTYLIITSVLHYLDGLLGFIPQWIDKRRNGKHRQD